MSGSGIREINQAFYDALWSRCRLERPESSSTWPAVKQLLPQAERRLEIGPGLRPRLPIGQTHFIDLSGTAVRALNARGGHAAVGDVTQLPFPDGYFDLVGAFDVIEHAEDCERAFREAVRVLKPRGALIFSVPLHPEAWTEFDEVVGHARRFEIEEVSALLTGCRLALEQSAPFGSRPRNPQLLRLGMTWLQRSPAVAMAWFNWLFRPVGRLLQSSVPFVNGLIDAAKADGIVLVCRRLP